MKISKVTQKDIAALKRVARDALIANVPVDDETRNSLLHSIKYNIESFIDYPNRAYLKVGDIPIAYILIKDYWNLAHLFVSPEHQRKGLGKQLLLSAIDLCREKSNNNFLRVNSSLNAVGFYEKLGFTPYTPESPIPAFVKPLIYHFK